MTTATTTAPVAAGPAAAKTSILKSKKFILALIAVLLAGGVGYKVMMPAAKPGPPTGGDIVTIDPTTLNLADGHYLKIGVAVQLVKGKATLASFRPSHTMQLIINEFTGRPMQSLTNTARQTLMTQLNTAIKQAYPGDVFTTYLTQFVVQ